METASNRRLLASASLSALLVAGAMMLPAFADEPTEMPDELELLVRTSEEEPDFDPSEPPQRTTSDPVPEDPQESSDNQAAPGQDEPSTDLKPEADATPDIQPVPENVAQTEPVPEPPAIDDPQFMAETLAETPPTNSWDPSTTPESGWLPNVPAIEAVGSADAQRAAAKFSDVSSGDWHAAYVGRALAAGVMTGYSASVFGPDDNLTRGQVATIIYRFFNPGSTATTVPANYAQRSSFADVPGGAYYTAAIEWCRDKGIVTGYSDGVYFGPEDLVTREQLAVMLWRAAGQPTSSGGVSSFPDAWAISSFAVSGMAWCKQAGILTGDGQTGNAMPQGYATRGQMAKMTTVAFGL